MIKNYNSVTNGGGTLHPMLEAALIKRRASGSIASFSDGADGLLIKRLVAQINPVQSGSGDPSPDNERPITGWTGLNVAVSAKNLVGGIALANAIKAAIPTATINTENKTVSFAASAGTEHAILGELYNYGLTFKPDTRYTFILTISKGIGVTTNLRAIYTDGTSASFNMSGTEKETKAFVTASGKTVRSFQKQYVQGTTVLYYEESGVFEDVLTVDDFVPYVGETIPIDWEDEAGTVYGCSLNVTTGVLTVDKGYYLARSADIETVGVSSGYKNALFKSGTFARNAISGSLNGLCSSYPIIRGVGTLGCSFLVSRPRICDPRFTDLATASAIIDSDNIQIVYPLAQPITVQLDPVTISTLLGENNIWADCGDVDVEYYADATLAYEQLLAAVNG